MYSYSINSAIESNIGDVYLNTDDDDLNILGDSNPEGLFDFKHTPKDYQRAAADFVARRKITCSEKALFL